jgi:hypothetical protein
VPTTEPRLGFPGSPPFEDRRIRSRYRWSDQQRATVPAADMSDGADVTDGPVDPPATEPSSRRGLFGH